MNILSLLLATAEDARQDGCTHEGTVLGIPVFINFTRPSGIPLCIPKCTLALPLLKVGAWLLWVRDHFADEDFDEFDPFREIRLIGDRNGDAA